MELSSVLEVTSLAILAETKGHGRGELVVTVVM